MKVTLRIKFFLFSTLLVTIIMASVTYFFTIRELNSRRAAVESQISRIAQNIATMQLLDQQDWNIYQNYISQLMAFNKDIVYIAIYDDRNALRAHTLNLDLIEADQALITRSKQAELVRRLDQGLVAEESKDDLRTEAVNIQVGDRVLGSIHVGFSIIDINRELQRGILLNVVLVLFFLFISGILSVLISRRLTHPLERLSQAMEAVNKGDLDQQVKPTTRDEIARLTHSFNEMVIGLRERQIIENLGLELGTTFQLNSLASLIRERLKNAIGATNASIFIKNKDSKTQFVEMIIARDSDANPPTIDMTETVKTFLLKQTNGFMIQSAPSHVCQALKRHRTAGDQLVIPMLVKEELLGLLFFTLPDGVEKFTVKQQHFATILANQAAIALENALLYEELREQERFKRELEIAREVQKKLLPDKMPEIAGFHIDSVCQPAQEVGGDYFDFFQLDDNHLGIVIADVSGKGTSASFYMAELKGMMLQMTSTSLSPKNLLIELNRKLYENIERRIFVTMIYGIIDIKEKKFVFARAGHNPLLKIGAKGNHHFYTPHGIGLGLDAGIVFDEQLEEIALDLKAEETLIFYTDGVTEARNSQQEEFGEERLLQSLLSQKHQTISRIKDSIMESLNNFMGGTQPHDDITMIVVQCKR